MHKIQRRYFSLHKYKFSYCYRKRALRLQISNCSSQNTLLSCKNVNIFRGEYVLYPLALQAEHSDHFIHAIFNFRCDSSSRPDHVTNSVHKYWPTFFNCCLGWLRVHKGSKGVQVGPGRVKYASSMFQVCFNYALNML